jgi:hypothetical protein
MESYMQISNLMHIAGFWTNLHQVRSGQNIWKPNMFCDSDKTHDTSTGFGQ